jgi:lipopolysaccharide transport system ATP-binding protein
MSDAAIRVHDLGKRYQLGEREPYRSAREALARRCAALVGRVSGSRATARPTAPPQWVWALKNVSFELGRGDVVGIIGRNGAGKSTLLKILSRITAPTEGRAEIHGRVGSLLEVGTGFHPELTGRQNIYLNGAVLGMNKAEIEQKFDEIVAFAEIEKFLDTPVKRYSSGMYVRLAFAVAAHMEPEILLVDEVLAVGDAAFRRKCLGRMGEVARGGRTVLFVSHSMAAVNQLCHRVLWLELGTIQMVGPTRKVVEAYLSAGADQSGECRWDDPGTAPGTDKIRLRALRVVNAGGEPAGSIDYQESFTIQIEYDVLRWLRGARIGFFLVNGDGVVVFAPNDVEATETRTTVRAPGRYVSCCTVPGMLLNSGAYALTASADVPGIEALFYQENAVRFHVERVGGAYSARPDALPGVIAPPLRWRISPAEVVARPQPACEAQA